MSDSTEEINNIKGQVDMKTYKFIVRNVFENISERPTDVTYVSDDEDHFGSLWSIGVNYQKEKNLRVMVWCRFFRDVKEWSIDTEFEIHILHPNGSSICKTASHCFKNNAPMTSFHKFIWEPIEKEYFANNELIVEIRMKTMKTKGIYKENLRNFDDEECSDVTLVVNDRRFHVSKLYLCARSSYFKGKFLGELEESKKLEIKLNGVEAEDLQKYLEALYGENVIDETTVEGIIMLADIYDTKKLVQKCERFLLEVSTKTWKKKLEMAVKYNLFELKNRSFFEIQSIKEFRRRVGCHNEI